jgi:hypothetical protein
VRRKPWKPTDINNVRRHPNTINTSGSQDRAFGASPTLAAVVRQFVSAEKNAWTDGRSQDPPPTAGRTVVSIRRHRGTLRIAMAATKRQAQVGIFLTAQEQAVCSIIALLVSNTNRPVSSLGSSNNTVGQAASTARIPVIPA